MRRLSPSDEGILPTSLWMIPYADLMTNMVILFLVLFAFAYNSRSPEYERAVAQIEEEMAPKDEKERKTKKLREAEIALKLKTVLNCLSNKDFGVRVTERYIHLTLPSPVLFRKGSDRLSPRAARILKPLAVIFRQAPNPVLVKGHTDDLPIIGGRHKTNWELSAARAFAVMRYLAREGVAPSRFDARGYGEFRPLVPNTSEANRARNRRIEISLVREIARSL